jgi:hypothetical protein
MGEGAEPYNPLRGIFGVLSEVLKG